MAIRFWLNDKLVEEHDAPGTTTLLRYLRDQRGLTGTKEGCAEGDCGACTVAILEPRDDGATFRAVNSCLMFLPMLQGKRVYTVEALRDRARAMTDSASGFHPVQLAMVDTRGSQCGYCTPGIVMSLFEACYRDDMGAAWQVDDQLCGNLCRCTGYRPIRDAADAVVGTRPADRFLAELNNARPVDAGLDQAHLAGGQLYLQPRTLEELWTVRAAHPDAVLVAGGTDLGLAVTKRHAKWPVVIGLEALAELQSIESTDDGWVVGAGVTLTRMMEVVDIPAFQKMMRVFGSRQIRSRATLGGNLVNASPIGDTPPVMIALGATFVLAGSAGERRVAAEDFFVDYRKTALQGDEILKAVEIARPGPGVFVASYKVSKRRELDISTCAAGMAVCVDDGVVIDIRLAYGGLAATPKRATRTEDALRGHPWTEASVEAVLPLLDLDFTPLSDHRGSERYRRLLARNLLRGFFLESQQGGDLEDRPVGTVATLEGSA